MPRNLLHPDIGVKFSVMQDHCPGMGSCLLFNVDVLGRQFSNLIGENTKILILIIKDNFLCAHCL